MRYSTCINIGNRTISAESPSYFIADIGANHDGDLNRAKDLIWLAKDAGADCAKFQHFRAKDIVSDTGFKNLSGSQSHQSQWKKSVYQIYKEYECKEIWTEELISTCHDAEIDFMTTPYDIDAIKFFANKVPGFKIGSGDITWLASVELMAKQNLPILLATGASDITDVERAVSAVLENNTDIILMQCNTNYTADLENYKYINLKVLSSFALHWPGMLLGLSDHTFGHSTVLGAIALGARVIEKHFSDDNSRPGPDHKFAMNSETWREMVLRSRELELALGDGIKRIEANEYETSVIQRRAICARFKLNAGDVLTKENLHSLRPCPEDGIPPYKINSLLGKRLLCDKISGAHISWMDVE